MGSRVLMRSHKGTSLAFSKGINSTVRAMVCLDKESGGLGVKDLGCLNKALLS